MATIKSYTDLSQSKKLAEILPLESADMCYLPTHIGDEHHFIASLSPYSMCSKMTDVSIKYCTPCWSLAALLNILPNEIITDNRFECHYQIHIRKYDGYDNTTLHQIAYGNNRGSSGSWHDMINTGEKENLIDAVFQMICWLKENKKL